MSQGTSQMEDPISNPQIKNSAEDKKVGRDMLNPKQGLGPRPIGGNEKLGTFSGVFVPTCLNIFSILMFLRFGFILGQAGITGMLGMLLVAYTIDLITVFSLSAIASNGTVRGGGAYYLISRSLGPEFGGSIGVVFFLGLVLNTSLNAVGLIDCIKQNVGSVTGNWYKVMPEGRWYEYLYATVVLLLCTGICLAGSAIFARASTGLLIILLIATFSIPFSALIMSPWEDRALGIYYTGLSLKTLKGNLLPQLTKGAAGSQLRSRETFQDLFGILFPATSGIFAGASMSGDLKHPSKAIPKGTLYGLGITFVAYTLVILAMASTITRASFLHNVNVIQDTNVSGILVLAGEFASSFFSTLMGVIGSAKLLQALARDKLLPGFATFGQGTKKGDEPLYAIFFSYLLAQLFMLADINRIASFVTMIYLMTFLVMNLATFLLKIGSAPNFRPSFHFFSWETALAGTIMSGAAMFFVDGFYATGCIAVLMVLFLLIHYTSPPRSWGDVSQSLIYHQVRKYLLRLRPEHVKFWRPQILLLVNDPRRQYKLIQFCNSMKKGALYILGHVIVSPDFGAAVPEARRQQAAWTKYIEYSKVKAFVNIAISPVVEWGARNLVLGAGLGGMRPNIAVLGFYNMDDLRHSKPLIDIPDISRPPTATSDRHGQILRKRPHSRTSSHDIRPESLLPTDSCKMENMVSVSSYVTILEDLLHQLQINVAVAKGFQDLEFPEPKGETAKTYIDLWPIQMSAEIGSGDSGKASVLTTNFDTYTLILQLGCILHTVPAWRRAYKLRVAVFVEYESDVEEERGRVKALLVNLRIEAEVLVFWLASGSLQTYEVVVNGRSPSAEAEEEVNDCLKAQEWWDEIRTIRGKREHTTTGSQDLEGIFTTGPEWPEASFQQGPRNERVERFLGIRKLLRNSKRRHTISGLSKLGINPGMRTHSSQPGMDQSGITSTSETSDSSSGSGDESENDLEDVMENTASEGDLNERRFDRKSQVQSPAKITRRRSHGDSLRNPTPSKRSTGAKEPTSRTVEHPVEQHTTSSDSHLTSPTKSNQDRQPRTSESAKGVSTPNATTWNFEGRSETVQEGAATLKTLDQVTPKQLEEHFSPLTSQASLSKSASKSTDRLSVVARPSLSRHTSMPKFSSKPVPVTKVATEDGPGPSIMFTDTPSPPSRKSRLPSVYDTRNPLKEDDDHIPEVDEIENDGQDPPMERLSRSGSTYSTQSVPLSFNDLPCRAQHLILNELIRSQSSDTAVVFTTLPSPVAGTSKSEEACVAYLSDLEVLCRECPPCLMVHSNSMTVTMSL
ncbi:MAG: hypothetical protein M1818_003888 [Claussenomyces sp. TS43310]|nr:MAG: hypothetical protein M1818_003888 [Claussenomyces sp. TS43310]